MPVSNISSGNKALEFIDFRIKAEKYRGSSSSQHNRYVMSQIIDILKLLDKYAPIQELMAIRTSDLSRRPQNTDDEIQYAKFCNEAKEKTLNRIVAREMIFILIYFDMLVLLYHYRQQTFQCFMPPFLGSLGHLPLVVADNLQSILDVVVLRYRFGFVPQLLFVRLPPWL